ncbi:MAG: hypothetical protein AUK33_05155 [Flavobacteriaceae bacterium CG2_30_34_30]|nr:MAG: hypothetical protein AUK33_05155 [Flavobacteriaceae bacterium CG2_30_34_30]PIQ17064.1 MAG: hypothetical protein COW66_13560 [Flavobacteriaceae bacterium CG18_big_fil_WC_8_21_14_2_50_34_36]PIV48696.1 MAG: hypothetical protein COS19_12395 [Flavobacteriaceae bacterium CG02_land_8_20_14_3_00_34_13]PIZ08703.1 MAG: hypothetical protein COY56_02605 [Flavobacteriaceae bacterium CG_4_10_14_0_8_um_filter_34_31]
MFFCETNVHDLKFNVFHQIYKIYPYLAIIDKKYQTTSTKFQTRINPVWNLEFVYWDFTI